MMRALPAIEPTMNAPSPLLARDTPCTLLAADRQRSPLLAITAAQRQALMFTAYGTRTPPATPLTTLGFTGERLLNGTGYYLLGNGYRALNPTLMRFNSPDMLSPFGQGGLNGYAYCAGDPINRVDPDGTAWSFRTFVVRLFRRIRPSTQPATRAPVGQRHPRGNERVRFRPPDTRNLHIPKASVDSSEIWKLIERPFLVGERSPPLSRGTRASTSGASSFSGSMDDVTRAREFSNPPSISSASSQAGYKGGNSTDWGWGFMGDYTRRVHGTPGSLPARTAAVIRDA